ncbi:endo-1,3(4)-beta-glucanase [Kickxella alabastrina]|uniref:endo-1,3(4)-beta-glucanase n=1 Tax=Kickxella alabastrina TaxID=61397 RepID=UPI0022200E2E|nr:endo-1,3(4)-beta-glucanase [Kickxella alabastrina]KAI7832138.1 endo-1,3(4)-beta-glucanase [Kickxella alabastrina]
MPLSDRIRRLAHRFSGKEPTDTTVINFQSPSVPPLPPRALPQPLPTHQQQQQQQQPSLKLPRQQAQSSRGCNLPWSTADPQSVLNDRIAANSFKVSKDLIDPWLISQPVPTNTWWQNLLIENGDQPVVTTPYMVRCIDSAMTVCAPTPLVQENYVASIWHDDWKFVLTGCQRRVSHFDPLSVTVAYYQNKTQVATVPLVRGSAFVTVVFDVPTVLCLTTVHAILSADACNGLGTAIIRLNSGATWLVCCEGGVELKQSAVSELVSCAPVQGAVRLAMVSNGNSNVNLSGNAVDKQAAVKALLSARNAVPVGGNVSIGSDTDGEATFTIDWATRGNSGHPLMCALPHHQMVLNAAEGTELTWVDSVAAHWTSRGRVRAVLGSRWQWAETLEPLGFSGQSPLNDADTAHLCTLVAADAQSLTDSPATLPPDPYFFGKAVARAARIALIADEIGDAASCDLAASRAMQWLDPWLNGTNPNYLLFDTEWCGLVSQAGLSDPGADFGQGRYNDHHFHYGYFVYAAAALAKLRPNWVKPRIDAFDLFARDYCNTAPTSDAHFPFMRCFDFYDGHSWASGLFAFADSRNQESTSEAINAYYAAYLYAAATGRPEIAQYVRAVLQLEVRAARTYWHLGDLTSSIYPEEYARGKAVVGILWSSKADFATFFGSNPEFVYGIQFLPYTPASALLLKRQWVADIWPKFLCEVAERSQSEPWREIIHLAYAVVNKKQTAHWNKDISSHDDGNSASNSYYWIATAAE